MKSTLAPNKRYLLVRIESDGQIDFHSARPEISKDLEIFFGIEGISQVQPRILDKLCKGNMIVIRCIRGEEMRLVAALALIGKIRGVDAHAHVQKISGTLRALRIDSSTERK